MGEGDELNEFQDALAGFKEELSELINDTTNRRFSMFAKGLEDRLADAMTKALDIVTADFKERIRDLEEDQARILRHLGLKAMGSIKE